jgi:hypothetical protein
MDSVVSAELVNLLLILVAHLGSNHYIELAHIFNIGDVVLELAHFHVVV